MKKDYNFIPDDDEDMDIEFLPDWVDDPDQSPEDGDSEEDCPYLGILTALTLQDKPLGIMWTVDKMMEFLKARGYKLLERKGTDGNEYFIALKPSDSSIPDSGHSNIKEVFDNEVQDILMKWILKIATEV